MPRVKELPPVPEKPAVSPPAWVPGEEKIVVPGLDGQPSLEGALRVPQNPERAVLLSHPHPLYGGTMHSAVVLAVAKVLHEQRGPETASLRFNYRGVGTSEGSYGAGKGETEDVRAALRLLRERVPGRPITVCGYSFGTWVALRAASIEHARGDIDRIVLIAPAVRVFQFVKEDAANVSAPIAIFVGDDDEFCDVAEAEELARTIGATLEVLPNSDHYFIRSRRKLAELVVPALFP
jgi:alpha/beta superfamily hydrolase